MPATSSWCRLGSNVCLTSTLQLVIRLLKLFRRHRGQRVERSVCGSALASIMHAQVCPPNALLLSVACTGIRVLIALLEWLNDLEDPRGRSARYHTYQCHWVHGRTIVLLQSALNCVAHVNPQAHAPKGRLRRSDTKKLLCVLENLSLPVPSDRAQI